MYRWLRQPLLDVTEINHRLDTVEILKDAVNARSRLVDSSLKGIPDLETIISKYASLFDWLFIW
jgi:DNA mismatch repair ATPase MutS